jgi:hypothetical protein
MRDTSKLEKWGRGQIKDNIGWWSKEVVGERAEN